MDINGYQFYIMKEIMKYCKNTWKLIKLIIFFYTMCPQNFEIYVYISVKNDFTSMNIEHS